MLVSAESTVARLHLPWSQPILILTQTKIVEKRFQRMRQILFRLLSIGALILAVMVTALSLLGSLTNRWWISELLSQPRPQYALVLTLCLPILAARFQRAGWLILVPLFLNMAAFTPLYFGTQPPATLATGSYSLLHYILDNTLRDHTAAFAYIRNHPVDILSLQELTPELDERLATELPGYRVVYSQPMTNAHGSDSCWPTGLASEWLLPRSYTCLSIWCAQLSQQRLRSKDTKSRS